MNWMIRHGWGFLQRFAVRTFFSVLVFALIQVPLVEDVFFEEHFEGEATMPGSAFMSFDLMVWVVICAVVYLAARLIASANVSSDSVLKGPR
jgi:hypothetical protein